MRVETRGGAGGGAGWREGGLQQSVGGWAGYGWAARLQSVDREDWGCRRREREDSLLSGSPYCSAAGSGNCRKGRYWLLVSCRVL